MLTISPTNPPSLTVAAVCAMLGAAERVRVGVGGQPAAVLLDRLRQPVVEGPELIEWLGVVVDPGDQDHRPEPHGATDDRQLDPVRLLLEHPLDVRQRGRHREALEELGMVTCPWTSTITRRAASRPAFA